MFELEFEFEFEFEFELDFELDFELYFELQKKNYRLFIVQWEERCVTCLKTERDYCLKSQKVLIKYTFLSTPDTSVKICVH